MDPFNPFKEFTHGGTLNVPEILFHTRFDYMFPLAAENPECTLAPGATTEGALLSLGAAMVTDTLAIANDSTIPAVFTYLGQFIDHNITAQTDRELGVSRIATPDGMVMDLTPLPAREVTQQLINGRRPLLDLSQVYGDGPPLGAGSGAVSAGPLFDPGKLLKVAAAPPGFDVPRTDNGTAIIADMRNNENLNVCQLHCAFLLFHNKVADGLPAALSADERFIQAQQLVRWAYQYIVLNDYLPAVCDPTVVADVRANGLRYYSPDDDRLFMPLEFSVAAFRFGHSMIRPNYELSATTTLTLAKVLGVGALLGPGAPPQIAGPNIIEWQLCGDRGTIRAAVRAEDRRASVGRSRRSPGQPPGKQQSDRCASEASRPNETCCVASCYQSRPARPGQRDDDAPPDGDPTQARGVEGHCASPGRRPFRRADSALVLRPPGGGGGGRREPSRCRRQPYRRGNALRAGLARPFQLSKQRVRRRDHAGRNRHRRGDRHQLYRRPAERLRGAPLVARLDRTWPFLGETGIRQDVIVATQGLASDENPQVPPRRSATAGPP
ncbi:MAG: peroxidase family protein [Solirubrobacteraceae bacterium]